MSLTQLASTFTAGLENGCTVMRVFKHNVL
jgi:hypothetical protein